MWCRRSVLPSRHASPALVSFRLSVRGRAGTRASTACSQRRSGRKRSRAATTHANRWRPTCGAARPPRVASVRWSGRSEAGTNRAERTPSAASPLQHFTARRGVAARRRGGSCVPYLYQATPPVSVCFLPVCRQHRTRPVPLEQAPLPCAHFPWPIACPRARDTCHGQRTTAWSPPAPLRRKPRPPPAPRPVPTAAKPK